MKISILHRILSALSFTFVVAPAKAQLQCHFLFAEDLHPNIRLARLSVDQMFSNSKEWNVQLDSSFHEADLRTLTDWFSQKIALGKIDFTVRENLDRIFFQRMSNLEKILKRYEGKDWSDVSHYYLCAMDFSSWHQGLPRRGQLMLQFLISKVREPLRSKLAGLERDWALQNPLVGSIQGPDKAADAKPRSEAEMLAELIWLTNSQQIQDFRHSIGMKDEEPAPQKALVPAHQSHSSSGAANPETQSQPDWRGEVIGHQAPDYDPVYTNLGPVTGHTYDGDPIYEKMGTVYGQDETGIITGYTPYGVPRYNGEQDPTYLPNDYVRVVPELPKKVNEMPWL